MDALWPDVEDRKPLVRLGLSPQLERTAQEPTTFLLAILLDQLLDARPLCRSISVWRSHAVSVRETRSPRCALLDSANRFRPLR